MVVAAIQSAHCDSGKKIIDVETVQLLLRSAKHFGINVENIIFKYSLNIQLYLNEPLNHSHIINKLYTIMLNNNF